jgi:hypothetical protein
MGITETSPWSYLLVNPANGDPEPKAASEQFWINPEARDSGRGTSVGHLSWALKSGRSRWSRRTPMHRTDWLESFTPTLSSSS